MISNDVEDHVISEYQSPLLSDAVTLDPGPNTTGSSTALPESSTLSIPELPQLAESLEATESDQATSADRESHSSSEDDRSCLLVVDDDDTPLNWAELPVKDGNPESLTDDSPSRTEWLRQKHEEKQENKHLDRLMSMTGIEDIKSHFLWVKDRVTVAKQLKESLNELCFDLVLHGNDGTGKRTIAELYAEFLYGIGAVPRREFVHNSHYYSFGDVSASSTVVFFQKADSINHDDMVEKILEEGANVVFILSYREFGVKQRNALEANSESCRRFSNRFKLEDYREHEVSQILKRLISNNSKFGMQDNFLFDILTRKILKSHVNDTCSYRNVHAITNELEKVYAVRRKRVDTALITWAKSNPLGDGLATRAKRLKTENIIVEDILGPERESFTSNSPAWRDIQELVGMQEVKSEIESLIHLAEFNYQSERLGQKSMRITHHRCFLGDPGVGKTTFAFLYARLLAELGILSSGHMVVKAASDLIRELDGTSEALEEAQGGVLVIDDAHLFFQEAANGNLYSDSSRQGVIDTLVSQLSGDPNEDLCVILCGYTDRMEKMFLKSNPGLRRRFPLENAIWFANYSETELCQILDQKIKKDGLATSDEARNVAYEILGRIRTRPNFGNGGDVETLLSRAKLRRVRRLRKANIGFSTFEQYPLEAKDFDPDFDRSSRADNNRGDLFEGFVGFHGVIEKFRRYQKMAVAMRRRGVDPRLQIPWAFVFKGPPGTGKTSTARKAGKLFYDMGFLSSDEVVVCSVTNLIGEYLGHTGPKVINCFESGLGKVLFIDEAYRLNGVVHGGSDEFHREAVGEIVNAMTNPRYARNMIIILAGYEQEMEGLLSGNPGLRSRFPTTIDFPHLAAKDCLMLLIQLLSKFPISIQDSVQEPGGSDNEAILKMLAQLTATKGWANGRDVETLANTIIEEVFVRAGESVDPDDSEQLVVSFDDVIGCFKAFHKERLGGVYRLASDSYTKYSRK